MDELIIKKGLRLLLRLGFVVAALLVATDLLARPGGGGGFSSGGGRGSGGGGGGGSGDIEALIYILYYVVAYPYISVPLIAAILIWYLIDQRRSPQTTITSGGPQPIKEMARQKPVREKLQNFRKSDGRFSEVLFLDFASHLYYQFHSWRSKPEFKNLAPYIHPVFMDSISKKKSEPVEVNEIVIGSADIIDLENSGDQNKIIVSFEANYTETKNGRSRRFIVRDEWKFSRKKGIASKDPTEMAKLGCPNCGAQLELTETGECKYCGTIVNPGEKQWQLFTFRQNHIEEQSGKQFGTYVAETGTDYPTIIDPELSGEIAGFCNRHNSVTWDEYFSSFTKNIAEPYMKAIYQSWEAGDWEKARVLMTDNLFRSQYYWMEAYGKEGLTNKLDHLQIGNIVASRLVTDKYYESLTVRIFASVIDFLLQKDSGKMIGGSKSPRQFSEYWTFIRRTGVEKKESDSNPANCPNCGAPVSIGMAGICNHCRAKVTTGEFGWVLAVITQDEVYRG